MIDSSRYKGEKIEPKKALEILASMLKGSKKGELLCYMQDRQISSYQDALEFLLHSAGAVLMDRSLASGAGEAGIIEGRGVHNNLCALDLLKCEVAILWGSSGFGLGEMLKDKTLIVIDPIRTEMAKRADLFLQPRPHSDLEIALLLSRFLCLEDAHDKEFCKSIEDEVEEFYELTQTLRIKPTIDRIGLSLGEIGKVLELVGGKKCIIVVGSGVQKYRDGADVLRSIDAFATLLGLFGKEGSGVYYVPQSSTNPLLGDLKRVPKVDVEFGEYKKLFVYASNPLNQLPHSKRVEESLRATEIIYYGEHANATSDMADLVISKKEVSEEELVEFLSCELGVSVESKPVVHRGSEGEFCFLDELDLDDSSDERLYLITPKIVEGRSSNTLYLHSSLGFADGEEVEVVSDDGVLRLRVAIDDGLRSDVAMIYSTTKGINNLTPSKRSFSGNSAIFQENRVEIRR
ncbi:MAG: molybdopterin-dependent oxidoreductase [Sulfuricurvum sp.]